MKVLVIIPARSGSKRVPGKNTRDFLGKPLIAYTIEQAFACPFVDRVVVDTDSEEFAKIAREYGADVPWLRPKELATDTSKIIESILYTVEQLKEKEHYIPSHVMLLQTTTPLRTIEDIEKCWEVMKKNDVTTVVSVFNTKPRPSDFVAVENGLVKFEPVVSNKEGVEVVGYNGFVYIMERTALVKEKKIITQKTTVVHCPEWRSVDIDIFEDWALAEFLYKNKEEIANRIHDLKK